MCYLGGHDLENMKSVPTFFGYIKNNKIVGVNSGHACPNTNNYRSRGLWVDPQYRGQGIGQQLLNAVKDQGLVEGYKTVWSYPRKSSWKTYQAVGFILGSKWQSSETSDANAYCFVTV
jgi:GNAT superfamily N-acetyltransferase